MSAAASKQIDLLEKVSIFYKKLKDEGYSVKQLIEDVSQIGLKKGAIFIMKPRDKFEYMEKFTYESIGNSPEIDLAFYGGNKALYLLPASVVEENHLLFIDYQF